MVPMNDVNVFFLNQAFVANCCKKKKNKKQTYFETEFEIGISFLFLFEVFCFFFLSMGRYAISENLISSLIVRNLIQKKFINLFKQ